MLRGGTTSVVDHFWVNGVMNGGALDAAMSAYSEIGIRAGIAPLVDDDDKINRLLIEREPELAESPVGAMPSITAAEYLEVLEAFFERWHGAEDGRLRCLAGPDGAQWCTLELLRGAMDVARRYQSGFHMHVNETKLQALTCERFLGKSTIAFLDGNELLRENTSLAHCVWVSGDDIERIARAGATVVHNSVCNLKLGSGFAPILDLHERGAHVALAADGAASNDNQNMFDVMKVAGLMHTVRSADHQRWLSARTILDMATSGGARVLGLEDELGAIQPGRLADLTLLDLSTPAFSPLNDPAQHLVYCENGSSVRTVIVNGRVVMEDGLLKTVDESAVLAEAREVWERRKAEIPPLDAAARRYLAAQERLRDWARRTEFAVDRL
jgi:5-methylthioadenosine/S-adenosylhomocysteine deaminase